jgi:HEAT repeat protein
MTRNPAIRKRLFCVALGIVGILAAAGQLRGAAHASSDDPPQFQNARVTTQTLQQPLENALRQWVSASSEARWLGYAVPQVNQERSICCADQHRGHGTHCGECALEDSSSSGNITSQEKIAPRIHLEHAGEMAIVFRAEKGNITKIRIFSFECVADAGGRDVLWLENVKPADSVSVLVKFVSAGESWEHAGESLNKKALTALALHADASADRALESFVSPDRPEWLRREAAFWLGVARGAAGLSALQKMAHNDPSTPVRQQVTFALFVSDQPGAVPEMIRMAREDQSSQVRGQALFWLAQKAGKKAEDAITGAIQNDPDTEVKKKAVFALSQMPKDEGVPKLIEVAQTNKNHEVRKQAMFWLGQSQDPHALAFFEKILAQ